MTGKNVHEKRNREARRPCEAGFSVVELMVVVIIMTIVAFATVPAFRSHTDTVNLAKGAAGVASSLKLARTRAVANNTPVIVTFNQDNGSYFLFEDEDGDGTHDGDETSAGPFETPDRINLDDVSFGSNTLTFTPAGGASETGAVVLANPKRLALRIDVTGATGLVYVSDMYSLDGAAEE
jgi:type II secretion system protein H